jgi:hypothetical protein
MKLILFFSLIGIQTISAQIYYGTNGLGRLEFINDSAYTISFFWLTDNGEIVDTGFYKQKDDIIWLSSKIRKPYKVISSKEEQFVGTGYPVLLKLYYKDYKNGNYKLGNEDCYGIFDTINNHIVYNYRNIQKDYILVIHNGPFYDRLKWEGETINFFTIKYMYSFPNDVIRPVYFDEFPLRIKGNKLIPIDERKMENCWINNGFYFPTMKESKKEKNFKTIARWSIGLQGLPCSICVPGP